MMIQINDKKECCGCTACESVCPNNAIIMQPDPLGFKYPKIDMTKCVSCGLCQKTCQFHNNYNRFDNYDTPIVYGIRPKNHTILEKSQSGGAFVVLSDYILENGGAVYGAGYESVYHIIHKRTISKKDRDELRGSKYVQSDLTGIFRLVRKDLKEGLTVLFSGTPCQVEGLRSFIGATLSKNLITLDLVCHAVPSPRLWEEYVKWVEKENGEKIIQANFRNKEFGWYSHYETFSFVSGKSISYQLFRYFFFYKHLGIRDSCTKCPYTNTKRVGDITIGDFWGWENYYNKWNDNRGVSLVMVNSRKGKELFEKIIDNIYYVQSNVEECMQPQLKQHVDFPQRERKEFVRDFQKRGFDYLITKKKYQEAPKAGGLLHQLYILQQKTSLFKLPIHYIIILIKKIKK